MRFGPCKALMCLVFSLSACGDVQELELEYLYEGQANLDLVLVIGFNRDSGDLRWSADIQALPGYSSYVEANFSRLLQACSVYLRELPENSLAITRGELRDCLDLGKAFGRDLFGNAELSLEDNDSLLNPSLQLSGETHLFVLFFYNTGNVEGQPRCVQLKAAERSGTQFELKGLPPSDHLSLEVSSPQLNLDCFPL